MAYQFDDSDPDPADQPEEPPHTTGLDLLSAAAVGDCDDEAGRYRAADGYVQAEEGAGREHADGGGAGSRAFCRRPYP